MDSSEQSEDNQKPLKHAPYQNLPRIIPIWRAVINSAFATATALGERAASYRKTQVQKTCQKEQVCSCHPSLQITLPQYPSDQRPVARLPNPLTLERSVAMIE